MFFQYYIKKRRLECCVVVGVSEQATVYPHHGSIGVGGDERGRLQPGKRGRQAGEPG